MDDAPTRIDTKLTDPDRPPQYMRLCEKQPPTWMRDYIDQLPDNVVRVWFGDSPSDLPPDAELYKSPEELWFWRKL